VASSAAGDYETRFAYFPTGELRSRTLPRAVSQYGPAESKVVYDRDLGGNPNRIVDARGNAFTNTFYDTGDIRTTERPSWWIHDADGEPERDEDEMVDVEMGDATPPATGDNRRGEIRERTTEERAEVTGEQPGDSELPESEGHGDFGEVKPAPMPDLLPRAGSTSFAYDNELRLTSVTDAASHATSLTRDPLARVTQTRQPHSIHATDPAQSRYITQRFAFDRNGNLRRRVDAEGFNTDLSYDQFDRTVAEATPPSGAATDPPDTTRLTYDENGNLTARQTPRGPQFTWTSTFDAVDRLISESNPLGDATSFEYDAAGNQTAERRPRGNTDGLTDAQRDTFTTRRTFNAIDELVLERDGLGQEARFEYDANGNQTRIDAPGAASTPGGADERWITDRTFDGRDLEWAVTRGTGQHRRTTVTEFDPNGNLRRTVKPAGVDEASSLPLIDDPGTAVTQSSGVTRHAEVREYTADDQLAVKHLPWGDRDAQDQERWRMDFRHDQRGRVHEIESAYNWNDPCDPSSSTRDEGCPTKTAYRYYDSGWIAAATEPTVGSPGGAAPTQELYFYAYDLRGLQTAWESLKPRKMHREYFPSGKLKLRRAEAEGETTRTYTYAYDANGSMTRTEDQQRSRVTTFAYDAADRQTIVDETWADGRDSTFRYDPDGNTTRRRTDGNVTGADPDAYTGGKLTSFEYDPLARETKTRVEVGGAVRETTSEYFPSGALRLQRKDNAVVETSFYDNDGQLNRLRRARPNEAPYKDQVYTYDRDGNRKEDERGKHFFNSRDQLVRWEPSAAGEPVTEYELNGAGSITKETAGSAVTEYDYVGDELRETRLNDADPATPTKTEYRYFGTIFGAVSHITNYQGTARTDTTEYDYDAFERPTKSFTHLYDTGGEPAPPETVDHIEYDGLDRRDRKVVREGPQPTDPARAIDEYSYVGSTESLAREEDTGDHDADDQTPDTTTRYGYDYNASGERLGQDKAEGSTSDFATYGKDANGSVEELTNAAGEVQKGPGQNSTYEYDPYGDDLRAGGENEVIGRAKENPFRFEGFYYDSGVKTYDMRARMYRPDVGRFLTQDRYESAAGDFHLQSDHLTQNRYAFAGGNPVSNIEWDGHRAGRGAYEVWSKFFDMTGQEVVLRWGRASSRSNPRRGPFGYRHIKDPHRPDKGKPGKHRNARPGWSDAYLARFIARVLVQSKGSCRGPNCETKVYTRQRVVSEKQISRNRFIWTIQIDTVIVGMTPEPGQSERAGPVGIITAYRRTIRVDKTRACGCL
jgi:RHS repeat-associated protein